MFSTTKTSTTEQPSSTQKIEVQLSKPQSNFKIEVTTDNIKEKISAKKPRNTPRNNQTPEPKDWNRNEIIILISSLTIGLLVIILIITSAFKKHQTGNIEITIEEERRRRRRSSSSNTGIESYQMREIGLEWRNLNVR
jgi:hypothetical protein